MPDDFKVVLDYEGNVLSDIFEKISTLLSVCFVSTSSSIHKNLIQGTINGQRMLEYKCSFDDISENKYLYMLYDWIYTDGNSIDKAIIAHNVMSLHCRYCSVMEIDEKVFSSIQSNYKLYLKNNVMQYIELKNKVAEFITDEVSKTGEYAMILLENFKNNMIALFGGLLSIFLANIVAEQPLDNIFTGDITRIAECVLIGSAIYLLICFKQAKYQMKKVEQ